MFPVIHVLRHRTYRRLFVAQVVALAGTGLATVALGLLAYTIAGARAGEVLGTALALKMVAYVAVAPVAAALTTHLPRRAVLVGADVVRCASVLALPFVGEVWQVYALVLVMQAASATFTPTFQSVIPDALPDEDDYTRALSLSRLAYDLEAVLSPVLAAALLLLVRPTTLFLGTAVGFAASALLVVATVVPARAAGSPDEPTEPFVRRVRHGAEVLVRTPALHPVLAINLVVAAGGAFVLVQTVVVVRAELGGSDGLVALVLAAQGVGSMAGAVLLPRLLRVRSERTVMLGGAALVAAATLAVPLALAPARPTVALAAVCVLWVLVGVGWSAAETPVGLLLRRHVAPADLPAAFVGQFSLSHACWLVTYPLAGWLGAAGLVPAALVLGVVAAAATVVAVRTWPRPVGGDDDLRPTTRPEVGVAA